MAGRGVMGGEKEREGLLWRWVEETWALGNGKNAALRPLWMSVNVGGTWKSGGRRRTLGRQRRRKEVKRHEWKDEEQHGAIAKEEV